MIDVHSCSIGSQPQPTIPDLEIPPTGEQFYMTFADFGQDQEMCGHQYSYAAFYSGTNIESSGLT